MRIYEGRSKVVVDVKGGVWNLKCCRFSMWLHSSIVSCRSGVEVMKLECKIIPRRIVVPDPRTMSGVLPYL
jgi:hypothetical protein